MSKQSLIAAISSFLAESGHSVPKRVASELCDVVFSEAVKSVNTAGRFSYPGFGTFTLKARGPRTYRNPRTGAVVQKAATNVVGFRPAAAWKNSVGDLPVQ